jgi:hypothetical protein
MKNEPSCWPEAVLMRAEPAREDEYPAYIIIKQPTAYPLPALTPNATDRFRMFCVRTTPDFSYSSFALLIGAQHDAPLRLQGRRFFSRCVSLAG